MKRHLIAALIIGLIAGGLVVGLDIAHLLARPEQAVAQIFPETTKRLMPAVGYGIVVIAAMGVAFLTLTASRRGRITFILAILLVELVGVAWVCSLYKLEFQPLPAMAAVALGYLGAIGFEWFAGYIEERRSRPPKIKAGPTPRPAPISVVPEAAAVAPVPAVAPKPVAPPPVVEKPRARARRGDSFNDSGRRDLWLSRGRQAARGTGRPQSDGAHPIVCRGEQGEQIRRFAQRGRPRWCQLRHDDHGAGEK